jgi:hypothetical protein
MAIVQPSSSALFYALKALLRIKPCKEEERIKRDKQNTSFPYFKVNYHNFILLYARLSARSSFDKTEWPSSSFGNPILLAISRQTDISLLSGRQYRKSSSLVSLNTKPPLGYFNFWA